MNRRLLIQQLKLSAHLNQSLVDGEASLNHGVDLFWRNLLTILQNGYTAFWANSLVPYLSLEACLAKGVPTRHDNPWQPLTFEIMTELLSAAFTNHFFKIN